MSQGVEILSVTKITPPSLPQTPPPTRLSFFDVMWIGLPAVQKLMLYPDAGAGAGLPFPTLVRHLKSSLSATLLDYLPLAGKLTSVPSAGVVEVDFSDPSAAFVEAESGLDLRRLATDENHDVGSYAKLVPDIDTTALPCPAFAVQATRFGCGGVAIGYSIHHAIADGKASLQFMQAWAEACRARVNGTEMPADRRKPPYNRSLIKHPTGEEIARSSLRSAAPNLPITRLPNLPSWEEYRLHLARRTFMLDAPSIRCLKRRATSTARAPSTFSAIAAHVWTCVVRAKRFDPGEEVFLLFLMDCRARLDPPLDDDYFGNCVRGIWMGVPAGELAGDDVGLVKACAAISKAVEDKSKGPLSDCENWVEEFTALPWARVVNASSSPRFRLYETDFGWGRPGRVEFVSMNGDGEFALIAGKEEGTVQVTVSLGPGKMEAFALLFSDGLSG